MEKRMYQPTRGTPKRENFVHQSRCLEQRHRDILEQNPQKISQCPKIPAWNKERHFLVKSSVPGIGPKDSQNDLMRKLITLEHLQQCCPKETWTYILTDGSAEDATCNGGAGVCVKYPDGTDDRLSFATGLYSTNYKAETEALRAAAAHIENSPHLSHRVVFLSDALFILQALQTGKDTDLNNLVSNLTRLCMKHTVILQRIPSHCGINGNETADTLAMEGTTYVQNDRSTTYTEVKTILKAKQQNLFKQNNPHSNRNDPYHLLTHHEQVSIFRLRTGHNRHLFHKLKRGDTDQCRCRTMLQTTEHLLHFCPNHESLQKQIWPDPTSTSQKLYGSVEDLQRTATFVVKSGETIWRTRKEKNNLGCCFFLPPCLRII